MSYPNVIQGSFGQEKVAQSTKIGNLPLGTRMVLSDGREFVHARASATALVAGCLYEGEAGSTGAAVIKSLAVSAAAVGATSVTVTLAGTVLGAGVYDDGYLFFSAGSSSGSVYKIKSHPAGAATNSTVVVSLADSDILAGEGVAAGTTTAGLRKNENDKLVLTTADTIGVNSLVGIATRDVTADYYCWMQKKGVCAALTDGTLIVGEPVSPSSALAGAVTICKVAAASTAGVAIVVKQFTRIGYCMSVAASTEYSLINLNLP